MSLQKKIIKRYQLLFPKETLRETSLKTGIQITRIFRILNGRPMKLNEFEKLNQAIDLKLADKNELSLLQTQVEEASIYLTNYEIGKIANYIGRKISNKKYARGEMCEHNEEAFIA